MWTSTQTHIVSGCVRDKQWHGCDSCQHSAPDSAVSETCNGGPEGSCRAQHFHTKWYMFLALELRISSMSRTEVSDSDCCSWVNTTKSLNHSFIFSRNHYPCSAHLRRGHIWGWEPCRPPQRPEPVRLCPSAHRPPKRHTSRSAHQDLCWWEN